MAIYHCSVKIGSRGKGQSAVAAAAYRSGSKLTDKEIGITSDYTRKGGVIFSEISLCPNAPAEYADREVLWNAVHQIEKTKDARLWREIEVALPKELNRAEQIETVREYVKGLTAQGMCADWSLHDKGDGNPHAHIMLTVRSIESSGKWAPKSRKVYDLDENGQRIFQKIDKSGRKQYKCHKEDYNNWNAAERVEEWRAAWAECCNANLAADAQVDHRSYERQGIDLIPTVHEGYVARKLEAKGQQSDRIAINENIRKHNKLLLQLRSQLEAIRTDIERINNNVVSNGYVRIKELQDYCLQNHDKIIWREEGISKDEANILVSKAKECGIPITFRNEKGKNSIYAGSKQSDIERFNKIFTELIKEKIESRSQELSNFKCKEWEIPFINAELKQHDLSAQFAQTKSGEYLAIYERKDAKAIATARSEFVRKVQEVEKNLKVYKGYETDYRIIDANSSTAIAFNDNDVTDWKIVSDAIQSRFGYDANMANIAVQKIRYKTKNNTLRAEPKPLDAQGLKKLEELRFQYIYQYCANEYLKEHVRIQHSAQEDYDKAKSLLSRYSKVIEAYRDIEEGIEETINPIKKRSLRNALEAQGETAYNAALGICDYFDITSVYNGKELKRDNFSSFHLFAIKGYTDHRMSEKKAAVEEENRTNAAIKQLRSEGISDNSVNSAYMRLTAAVETIPDEQCEIALKAINKPTDHFLFEDHKCLSKHRITALDNIKKAVARLYEVVNRIKAKIKPPEPKKDVPEAHEEENTHSYGGLSL